MADPISSADAFGTIFVGRPTGTPRPLADDLDEGPRNVQVVMEVSAVYKGQAAARQTVVVPTGGDSSCGVALDGPGDLLVLGSRRSMMGSPLPDGVYSTNACSSVWLGTDPARTGTSIDLSSLGDPRSPDPGASPTLPTRTALLPTEPLEWGFLAGGTVVALGVLGSAWWLAGRLRRGRTAEPSAAT